MHLSDKKIPPLTVMSKGIPSSEKTIYKTQTRGKWPSYKITKELFVYPIFRKDVEEYHDQYFDGKLGKVQVKYEFIR